MSGGFDLRKIRKIIACKLCGQLCDNVERPPKSMPCTHYICVLCMEFLIKDGIENADDSQITEEGGKKSYTFTCPYEDCTTTFTVSEEKGVEDLPTHSYLTSILSKFPPSVFKDLPPDSSSNSESETDQKAEQKEEAKDGGGESAAPPPVYDYERECQKHTGNELLLLCKECEETVCKMCLVDPDGKHMQHQLDEIDISIKRVMKDVEDELGSLSLMKRKFSPQAIARRRKRKEDQLRYVEELRDSMIKKVENTADQANSMITEWQNTTVENLSNLVYQVQKFGIPKDNARFLRARISHVQMLGTEITPEVSQSLLARPAHRRTLCQHVCPHKNIIKISDYEKLRGYKKEIEQSSDAVPKDAPAGLTEKKKKKKKKKKKSKRKDSAETHAVLHSDFSKTGVSDSDQVETEPITADSTHILGAAQLELGATQVKSSSTDVESDVAQAKPVVSETGSDNVQGESKPESASENVQGESKPESATVETSSGKVQLSNGLDGSDVNTVESDPIEKDSEAVESASFSKHENLDINTNKGVDEVQGVDEGQSVHYLSESFKQCLEFPISEVIGISLCNVVITSADHRILKTFKCAGHMLTECHSDVKLPNRFSVDSAKLLLPNGHFLVQDVIETKLFECITDVNGKSCGDLGEVLGLLENDTVAFACQSSKRDVTGKKVWRIDIRQCSDLNKRTRKLCLHNGDYWTNTLSVCEHPKSGNFAVVGGGKKLYIFDKKGRLKHERGVDIKPCTRHAMIAIDDHLLVGQNHPPLIHVFTWSANLVCQVNLRDISLSARESVLGLLTSASRDQLVIVCGRVGSWRVSCVTGASIRCYDLNL